MIKCKLKRKEKKIKIYKITLLLFAFINTLLLIWAIGLFDLLLNKNLNTNLENLPVIEAEYDELKKPPPDQELFPNSESPVWKSMEVDTYADSVKEKKMVNNENLQDKLVPLEKNKDNDPIENSNGNVLLENQSKQNIKELKLDNPKSNEKQNVNEQISEKDINNITIEKEKKINVEDANREKIIKNSKNFYIQLASLSEEKLVEKEWKRLKNKYKPELDNLTYITEKAKINTNKIFFRLLVGDFIDEQNARNFCIKIKVKLPCIVKAF